MTGQPAGGGEPARAALIAGVACYAIWGFIPLAFQQMGQVGADAWEIMGHRAVWGALGAALLVLAARQGRQALGVLRQPRVFGWLVLSTLLIAVNWTTYVLAVNGGRTLDASLGYYLNPLLNMAAGAWLFRERISGLGLAAIALAGIGVVLQTAALGHLPWVSLILAFTFCAYGVIRKRVAVDAQTGLFFECLLLAGPGLAWLIWLAQTGQGHFTDSASSMFWLVFAGPVTVIPMALFAWAARRMPLSTMGFLQFLAPTIVFVIGVSQGEPFGWLRGLSFGFIWLGVAVFVIAAVTRARAARRAARDAAEPV